MYRVERRQCNKTMPIMYMLVEVFVVAEIFYLIGLFIGLDISYVILASILLVGFTLYSLSKTFKIYKRMKLYCA
jgi:hypothetical protein